MRVVTALCAAFALFVGGGPIRLVLGAVLGLMSFGVTGAVSGLART